MKKLIIILLLLPYVYAISLGLPEQRDIIFEPNKQVEIKYVIGNSDPQPMNVEVSVGGGELDKYISTVNKAYYVPAYSAQPIIFNITFPDTLKPGLYPIRVDVSESAALGGMAGLTGVSDTINVISPHEEGFQYGSLKANDYVAVGESLRFVANTQNIGKTPLQALKGIAKLTLNGETIKEAVTNEIPYVAPFEKYALLGVFENTSDLRPGKYLIKLSLGDRELSRLVAIGQPGITVHETPLFKAGDENKFDVQFSIDSWATPIEDANIIFQITNLLKIQQKVTLQPGENTLHFEAKAQPGKSGKYRGRLVIDAPLTRSTGYFQADVEGTSVKGGIGFLKGEDEAVAGEATGLAPAKNKTFLILLLIASFAVFSFALGQYLARRKNEPQQKIIIPPQ